MSIKITESRKEKALENFARTGFFAKGIVYCLVSVLAFMAALGLGKEGGHEKAFKFIHEQTFGKAILVVVGICLLGFVMLRFFQAIQDSNKKGTGAKGLLRRAGYAISGLIHLGFSIYAFKMAFGYSSGSSSKQFYTAKVLQLSGGHLLIGIIGLVVIGQGIYQGYYGAIKKFMKKVELYRSHFRGTFEVVGMVGLTSRAIVLCLIGFLLMRAAVNSDPEDANGTEGAFELVKENFGNVILAVISVGLFLYGIFMFVRGVHERLRLRA